MDSAPTVIFPLMFGALLMIVILALNDGYKTGWSLDPKGHKAANIVIGVFKSGTPVLYNKDGFSISISKEAGWSLDASEKFFKKDDIVISVNNLR